MNALRSYSKTQQETASRERLMILLFQAALRHMRAGAEALEKKQFDKFVVPLSKASDIVMELYGTLDMQRAPELCKNLGDVYEFVSFQLISSISSRDPNYARNAEKVFAPIVEAFEQAVASLPADGAR